MKIENMGVRITDVPGFDYIEVTPGGSFTLKASYATTELPWSYDLSALTQLRNALDAALAERAKFDTAMTTPNPATLEVGQVLDGTEALPTGARVVDRDGDVWMVHEDGSLITKHGVSSSVERLCGSIYRPITIVNLP